MTSSENSLYRPTNRFLPRFWAFEYKKIPESTNLSWIEEIARALNRGVLPDDYYALPEQHAAGFGPDVLALQGKYESEREIKGVGIRCCELPQFPSPALFPADTLSIANR